MTARAGRWAAVDHTTPPSRHTTAATSGTVGPRPSHRKPYSMPKSVSKTIICPIRASGSRRPARFQHALPTTDANTATVRAMPQKPSHSAGVWPDDGPAKAGTARPSASAPVITPTSNDASWAERSGRRASQRRLTTV